MKVTALLISVLIASACAEAPEFVCDSDNSFTCFFKELAHQAKYHANKLGDKLKDVGTAVTNAAADQAKDLLSNGLQAALGTVMEHLTKEGLVGKREVAFVEKVKQQVSKGVSMLQAAKKAVNAAFEKAVKKLTGMMGDMTALKGIEEDADKKIDGIVEEFNKEGKKGFVAMAKTIMGKLQSIYEEGMALIKAKFGKKVEERAILGFDSFTDAWNAAKDKLSGLGGTISDTLKPHLDSLKGVVSDLADQAKGHGANLANAALDNFNQLKDKLSTHVETLKGHAKQAGAHVNNAVDALKEAVTAITNQTLKNVSKTLGDAVKTGSDAAGTVVDHFSGSY